MLLIRGQGDASRNAHVHMTSLLAIAAARRNLLAACMIAAMAGAAGAAAEDCATSADLRAGYVDADCDMLADPPTDAADLRDPNTLVWAYSPIEDPAVYAELFRPFTRHLAACVGRQIVYYPVQSEEAQVQAMADGLLHFAGFATGSTVSAVERAGAHPFAAKGTEDGMRGYRLIAIVRAESGYRSLDQLDGARIAHTTEQSNSGHHAPRRFFPEEGLIPGRDYDPIMSGGHAQSILGVMNGDYDMAAVASDVFERMIERARIERGDFRVLYQSPLFPTSSFALAHDLDPGLAARLRACFFDFEFPARMSREFHGDSRFVPVRYAVDWQAVRDVLKQDAPMPD